MSEGAGHAESTAAGAAAETPSSLPDRLPLTTVERYMLEDDRPSHPMTGVHELVVRGPLETAALQRAVDAVRRRHPLLCRVIDDSGRTPAWVAAPADATVRVDRAPASTPRTHPRGDWLDVRRELGLRIWVRDLPPETGPEADERPACRLSMAIHHCCADALGGLTALFDLFAHLSAANGGPPVPPPPNPERLFRRGEFYDRAGWLPGLPQGRLNLWGHLIIGLRRLSKRATLPLAQTGGSRPVSPHAAALRDAAPSSDAAEGVPVDAVSPPRSISFTEEETTRLRAAAKTRGMTLNDLLLRDLILALRAHNVRAGASETRADGRPAALRVSVPVNLRGRDDLPASLRKAASAERGGGLSVANKIGMALVTRYPSLADDPEALLASVHEEMVWVRRVERGRRFVEAIRLAQRLVGRTPERILGENCFATAVLSNIGDLGRVIPPALRDERGRLYAPAADPTRTLTVTEYATASPGRPLTRATVLAASYAGRLHLHLRTDPHDVADADADRLQADLAARVRRSASPDDTRND